MAHPSRTSRGGTLLWALIILALAAAVTTAFFWRGKVEAAAAPAFQTTAVDQGDIVQSVRATGRLHPVREVQVGSQISGIIDAIFVDFNDPVKKGELIARLDTSTFEVNVRLAEAELASAKAARVPLAEDATRQRRLLKGEFTTTASLETAEAQLQQAEAQVEIRRRQLEKASLELDRCFIRSPTDGLVISRNVDVGQTVAASLSAPVLFEIADDLARMQIIARVPEADIGVVEHGQRVEFRVDAFRDRRFPGRVIQVRNAPVLADNVVNYDTVIEIDNRALLFKPGMTAEVFIVTDERNDVLRVRNTALRARIPDALLPPAAANRERESRPDRRVVYLLSPTGYIEAVEIGLGITDGLHTEVLEGLDAGQRLVTGLALRREGEGGAGGSSLFGGRQAQF